MSCEGPVNGNTSSPAAVEEKIDVSDPPPIILEVVGEPSELTEIVETAEITFITPEEFEAVHMQNAVDHPGNAESPQVGEPPGATESLDAAEDLQEIPAVVEIPPDQDVVEAMVELATRGGSSVVIELQNPGEPSAVEDKPPQVSQLNSIVETPTTVELPALVEMSITVEPSAVVKPHPTMALPPTEESSPAEVSPLTEMPLPTKIPLTTEIPPPTEMPPPPEVSPTEIPPPNEVSPLEMSPPAKVSTTEMPPPTDVSSTEMQPPTDVSSTEMPPPTELSSTQIQLLTDVSSTEMPPPTEVSSTEIQPPTEVSSTEIQPPTEVSSTEIQPPTEMPPSTEASSPTEVSPPTEQPPQVNVSMPAETPRVFETLKPLDPLTIAETSKPLEACKAAEVHVFAVSHKTIVEPPKPPRCISRAPRKAPYTSSLITQSDIAQEILARAEKKRQTFPDAVDVLVAMKSPSQIRIPTLNNPLPPTPSPPKLPKLRDDNKCLDAKDLLLILQDGADIDQKPKTAKSRNPRPKLDLKIDPDLERELALKQLMEFSKKTERKPRNSNNNVDGVERVKRVRQIKTEKTDKPAKILKRAKNPVRATQEKAKLNRINKMKNNKQVKNSTQEKSGKPGKIVKQEKTTKQEKVAQKQEKDVKQEKGAKQEKDAKQEKGAKQEKDAKQDKGEAQTPTPTKPKKRASVASASNGPPAKRSNRELARLLQDEGAINMLYDIEKGDTPEGKSRLSSKTRLKKVLKKKAQDVEEAILAASSFSGSHRSTRTSDKRKPSVDSVGAESVADEAPQEAPSGEQQFSFQQPAEASKIIRRHSSSSSYSSRGSSPRRMSIEEDHSPSSSETTPSKTDLSSLSAQLAELHQESPSTEFLPQSAIVSELPQVSPRRETLFNEALSQSTPHPAASKTSISERTEKLIEMKVRELNLQPHHSALIKRLIVDKKNGLKERLQSEFAVKFKAALPQENHTEATPKAPGVKLNMQTLQLLKAKTQNLVSSLDAPSPVMTSPSKPVWKSLVEEDWDSADEDPDDPAPVRSIKLEEKGLSKSMEADISTIAENMLARLKAGVPISQLGSLHSRSTSKDSSAPLSSFINPPSGTLPADVAEIRVHRAETPPTESEIVEMASLPQSVSGPVPGSDVRLERMNAIIRLYIKPTTCRLPNSLNIKVLNELTQALNYLESSSDIRVIVLVFPPLHEAMAAISDSESDLDIREHPPDFCAGRISPAFRSGQNIVEVLPTDQVNHCNGIDLLSLCAESQDERRRAATQTATAIKDLTHKLATCSRLVCTAVSGKAIGLSVVLLAYCDFVLADETATFSTPYTQLGYLPEAAATHTLPHIIGRRKTSWLLLGNGTLSASEAEVCGLVTRVVLRRSHLAHELNTLARSLAATSLLASESAKGMMYHTIRSSISNLLSTEAKVLETHWSAPDTQHRMKNFAVQLILDMHKAQWKERESRVKESEVQIIRTPASGQLEEFEVPDQQIVYEEPSDHLEFEPLQPLDELHFEDPTVELQMPSEDHEYQLQQLR